MLYTLEFPSSAIEKKFKKALEDIFPAKIRLQIMEEIEKLAQNPRPCGTPKLVPPTVVYNYAANYRIRIGDHRVLYDISDSRKIVWILALRRRGEKTYK